MSSEERFVWARRLRWRVRGAWQPPAFVAATLLDALLLARLPVAGDRGAALVPALLLAGFLNLFAVAVAGPLLALWLGRWRPSLPRFAARDRAGTTVLAAGSVLLALAGLAHRGAVRGEHEALQAEAIAAHRYFLTQAPAAYRRNIGRLSTIKAGDDLYRTCLPGPDPRRALCIYVTTDQSPPGVTRDRSQEPNSALGGFGG